MEPLGTLWLRVDEAFGYALCRSLAYVSFRRRCKYVVYKFVVESASGSGNGDSFWLAAFLQPGSSLYTCPGSAVRL